MKAKGRGGSGSYSRYDDDEDWDDGTDHDYGRPAPRAPKRPPQQRHDDSPTHKVNVKSRPTNNQLLYKAYFRWTHYPFKTHAANSLPLETDACASVTAAFLQVLQVLHSAEQLRNGGTRRNVLQVLSTNTRRTKVVELSSGTHRVPDELKKHYLSDGAGGQYSTNLDRNRYGNDDNYLFTVIRYDLEFLGLCPCMVDVEIIDAKLSNQSVIVSAGIEACSCAHLRNERLEPEASPVHYGRMPTPSNLPKLATQHSSLRSDEAALLTSAMMRAVSAAAAGAASGLSGGVGSLVPGHHTGATSGLPQQPSGQLIALMQAQGQQPVASQQRDQQRELPQPLSARSSPRPSASGVSQLFDALVMAATGPEGATAASAGGEPPVTSPYANPNGSTQTNQTRPQNAGNHPNSGSGRGAGGQLHAGLVGPGKGKQLWSNISEVEPSLQVSRMTSFGGMGSLQNALDAFRAEEEIASQPLQLSDALHAEGGETVGRQRRRKPPRPNNSFLMPRCADSSGGAVSGGTAPGNGLGDRSGKLALREKSDENIKGHTNFEGNSGAAEGGLVRTGTMESGEVRAGFSTPGGLVRTGTMESGEDDNDALAKDTTGDEADTDLAETQHHMRTVPRQSSAVNLATRVAHAELKRLAAEVEALRSENQQLEKEGAAGGRTRGSIGGRSPLGLDASGGGQADSTSASWRRELDTERARTRQLEQDIAHMRAEMAQMVAARKRAEEQATGLQIELADSRRQINALLARVCAMPGALPGAPPSASNAAAAALQLGLSSGVGTSPSSGTKAVKTEVEQSPVPPLGTLAETAATTASADSLDQMGRVAALGASDLLASGNASMDNMLTSLNAPASAERAVAAAGVPPLAPELAALLMTPGGIPDGRSMLDIAAAADMVDVATGASGSGRCEPVAPGGAAQMALPMQLLAASSHASGNASSSPVGAAGGGEVMGDFAGGKTTVRGANTSRTTPALFGAECNASSVLLSEPTFAALLAPMPGSKRIADAYLEHEQALKRRAAGDADGAQVDSAVQAQQQLAVQVAAGL